MNNHSVLVNKVLLAIGLRRDILVWKNSTGVGLVNGQHVRYGLKGSPDIIGVLAGGRFLGLEIKTGKAVQTQFQKKFQKRFEELGGLYIVVRSIEDIKKIPVDETGI